MGPPFQGKEYPFSTERIARIAAQLSALPLELVEPVLAELPLYHVLQLHCASTARDALHNAIRISPAWSWLFHEHGDRLVKLWRVVNQFSMLWCGRAFMQKNIVREWSDSSAVLQARNSKSREPGEHVTENLELAFRKRFRTFLGSHNRAESSGSRLEPNVWLGRGIKRADRRAACMYLPASLLFSLIKDDKIPDGFESENPDAYTAADYTKTPPSIAFLDDAADALRGHAWTVQEAQLILPWIVKAFELLRQAKAYELESLKKLFDEFPELLKMPLAPQSCEPARQRHIARNLRLDARKAANSPIFAKLKSFDYNGDEYFIGRPWFRFRYAHCCLVPYNWCFDLFSKITEANPLSDENTKFPDKMMPLLKIAKAGLKTVYSYSDSTIRRTGTVGGQTRLIFRSDQNFALPVQAKELEWLSAFIKCVEWARKEYPDEYLACYERNLEISVPGYSHSGIGATMGETDYAEFVKDASVPAIVRQIEVDSKLCDENYRPNRTNLPSLLAFYLPDLTPPRRKAVLEQLFPVPELGQATRALMYESILQKILGVLKSNPLLVDESSSEGGNSEPEPSINIEVDEDNQASRINSSVTAEDELRICERILENLLLVKNNEGQDDSIPRVLSEVRLRLQQHGASRKPADHSSQAAGLKFNRKPAWVCYICRLHRHQSHALLPALCRTCGDFNLSNSRLSLPNNLDLRGRVALVTGGRVNLGFHTALRLLRCRACVIVTTRYPADAVMRFRREADSEAWESRLKILGADFRSAADAMAVAESVKDIIHTHYSGRLHILINNAAQTLTDSKETEIAAITRERALLKDVSDTSFGHWLPTTSYTPRLRGINDARTEAISFTERLGGQSTENLAVTSNSSSTVAAYSKSSWVQDLREIPYEDLISAHSVNTFVPLILIRELLPYMQKNSRALERHAYIVNVSSREGIFESRKGHPAKRGKHVHTNMSKAALNMITETEAENAWDVYGIAMNTVDPGYMSAAPEYADAFGGERPIGWSDGAGRVLWPIATGEAAARNKRKGMYSDVVWGQFLKHYGAVRVEPRFGRG
ncbi:hypothetical protein NLG97_g2871 [Lecanicillium saksenae]|uniref:Uncharacterized protein n=1 Tax=Lecanicillium saksenae TaxID=468837 RepID=A0ACC1R329_9HYPO|nr:hypothetical protein NLG97_g2871 [Lecanicillium saksenae]